MRKYIKSMRQQYDNNSFIFKQAKKMFHYEPHSNQGRPYCYSKPSKKPRENANEFKDEYSSVKDNKLQNNEINQSSWIAKLVNGIQQNSLEDLRLGSKEIEKKQSDGVEKLEQQFRKSTNKQQIAILDKKRDHQLAGNSEVPTKKNSFNFSKKKSDTLTEKNLKTKQKNDSFCQNQKKQTSKPKSVIDPKPQTKNTISKTFQSVIAKSQTNDKRGLGQKKKSLQNIYVSKGISESKSKSSLNEDNSKLSSLKPAQKIEKGLAAKKGFLKNENARDFKLNESLSEMQEIKCMTEKKDIQPELRFENNQTEDEYFSEPLFQKPRNGMKIIEDQKASRKMSFGSIRKNKALVIPNQEKGSSNCSFRQESTEAMMSPKFSSNNITLKDITNMKAAEPEDIISASDQKNLIDKYLRTDYSFKCNQVEADYGVMKAAAFKKISDKRYNYEIVENRQNQQSNRLIQTFNARDLKKEGYRHFFQKQQPVRQPYSHSLKVDYVDQRLTEDRESNCRRKLSYNKQNYCSLPIGRSLNYAQQNSQIQKPKLQLNFRNLQTISKEVYLQDSIQCALSEIRNQTNYPSDADLRHKLQFKEREEIKTKQNPTKYTYIVQNSSQKQQVAFQSTCKKAELKQPAGSQKLIDRLNGKLRNYITQHQLLRQEVEGQEQNMGETTYRNMQLNFNQLKKHRQYARK